MPYVDVGTHELWVSEKGSGPPILFVHGLFLDGRLFEAQADALSDRYRTVLVDVRDHGQSGGPPARWDLWDAATEICHLVDTLDLGPVHWAGLSMGGMIGLRAALAHPEQVRSLILMDTSADAEPRAWLHTAMARMVQVGGRPVARLMMPYVVRQMFSPDGRDSPAARTWTERILAMEPAETVRAALAVFERDSVLDRLDEIDQPSLVLVGEQDQATPLPHAQRLAEGLPDAELVRVPGAGHLTTLEAPEAVTDAIDSFMRKTLAHEAEAVSE